MGSDHDQANNVLFISFAFFFVFFFVPPPTSLILAFNSRTRFLNKPAVV